MDNLLNDINKLIELSRYYTYESEEKRDQAIKKLRQLKKHLENGRLDKVYKEGSEVFDDS